MGLWLTPCKHGQTQSNAYCNASAGPVSSAWIVGVVTTDIGWDGASWEKYGSGKAYDDFAKHLTNIDYKPMILK